MWTALADAARVESPCGGHSEGGSHSFRRRTLSPPLGLPLQVAEPILVNILSQSVTEFSSLRGSRGVSHSRTRSNRSRTVSPHGLTHQVEGSSVSGKFSTELGGVCTGREGSLHESASYWRKGHGFQKVLVAGQQQQSENTPDTANPSHTGSCAPDFSSLWPSCRRITITVGGWVKQGLPGRALLRGERQNQLGGAPN